MTVLGPGTLTIGAIGTPIDVSCLVNGARIAADKTQGEATTKLCGTKVPGSVTYEAKLSGNLDVDAEDGDTGLFALSWAEPGTEQPFDFAPNTAAGVAAAGTLIIDPLDFGADKYGDTLASDFEFAISGDVTFTYPGGATATFATGVPLQRAKIPPRTTTAAKEPKGKKVSA